MISFRTLCKERPGAYALAYTELADVLRKVSAAPQEDVARSFRQMTFNAAFGNTDDHLKNFWMIYEEAGYRLSEAFDLLPDIGERRDHTLMFQFDYGPPARGTLLDIALRWGIGTADAEAGLDAVLASIARFAKVAEAHGVPPANIKFIANDLKLRKARLARG